MAKIVSPSRQKVKVNPLNQKQVYIDILKKDGLNAAITALHRDTERMELETFEGQEGWQPQMWTELEEIRKFSRQLWEIGLRSAS